MSMNQADRPTALSELTDSSAGSLLYWASCACSLTDMVQALAHGADVNWVNGEDSNRTPLIQAVQGVGNWGQMTIHKDNLESRLKGSVGMHPVVRLEYC